MELALDSRSTMREAGPTLGLRRTWSAASREERDRNRLLRLDSLWEPPVEWKDASLSTRWSRPPDTSTAEDVVGVEAAAGDGGGGLGSGALERRRLLFEKTRGLNRPAVAWLPVFGLDSLWDVLLGVSDDWALPMAEWAAAEG